MKLNELIKKYEEYENGLLDFGAKIACQNFLKDLKQLDEPRKVKVPQCVHKYIQEAKEYNWDLQDLMKYIDDEDSKELQRWVYHECNQETLARAWINGYEVEEEKRYLFHWLLMKREEIERCADGDNQPGLSLARLSKIKIDVPDMKYQLKVVKLLDEMSADLEFFIDNITQTKMNQSKILRYYNEKIGTALERESNEQ